MQKDKFLQQYHNDVQRQSSACVKLQRPIERISGGWPVEASTWCNECCNNQWFLEALYLFGPDGMGKPQYVERVVSSNTGDVYYPVCGQFFGSDLFEQRYVVFEKDTERKPVQVPLCPSQIPHGLS
jgi:hypothetical protein